MDGKEGESDREGEEAWMNGYLGMRGKGDGDLERFGSGCWRGGVSAVEVRTMECLRERIRWRYECGGGGHAT